MRTIDIARRAARSLGQAKVRTFLTAVAISVGAFTVTLALAAGAGGMAYTSDLVKSNGDSQSLMVFAKMDQRSSDTPQEYQKKAVTTQQGVLSQEDIKKITDVDGVESVTPMYNVTASYITREGQKKYEVSVSVKTDKTTIPLEAGSIKDNSVEKGTIVLPSSYLDVLGFKSADSAVNQTIVLHVDKPSLFGVQMEGKDYEFRIAAVDKKSSTVLTYQPSVRMSPADAEDISAFVMEGTGTPVEYFGVSAQVKKDYDVKAAQQAIEKAGFSVMSQQDMQEALFTFINVVQYGAAGFGALAILASIFGIINTQYISVLERTQQIGLMKALGARGKDVGKLFRYEAAWVGFLGGILGTAGAWAMSALNPVIADALGLEEGTKLLLFSPTTSAVLVLSLVVVAIVAGYFPARKAAKLDPIEALRTE